VHRIVAALLAFLLVATALPLGAEHTVYTRYVVLGFVKDARGKLVRDLEVEVVRDKTGLGYPATTDEAGFYLIVVRLADEGVGETLTLRVGKTTTKITARFDPANHKDDRGTRIDVEGTKFVERTAAFFPTLARFMGPEAH
jgi:hypothetical protein